MVSRQTAYVRLTDYYKEFLEQRSADFTVLDYEYLQIEQALAWLAVQVDHQNSLNLLNLMERLSTYFEGRSLNNKILKYFDPCLKAAERTGQNPARIYLGAYRANWSLGLWNDAYVQILRAVQESYQSNPKDHAVSLKCLGSLQLNRGIYQDALKTFQKAKQVYQELGDLAGETAIKSEEAAYYLNKADYQMAYKLYSEIRDFEIARDASVSDHTLLMMGVVSRRLKSFTIAIDFLNQLFQRAQTNQRKGAYATAAHHIAWTYLDLGDLGQSRKFGELAQVTYEEIHDPRGASDADEQLGLIAMAMKQYEESRLRLERSATVRKQLGNMQGYASSLRRLAKLNFLQARLISGVIFLSRSLYIYNKIGMLPIGRVYKIVHDMINQSISS